MTNSATSWNGAAKQHLHRLALGAIQKGGQALEECAELSIKTIGRTADTTAQRFSRVPGMLSSLEVKVFCPT